MLCWAARSDNHCKPHNRSSGIRRAWKGVGYHALRGLVLGNDRLMSSRRRVRYQYVAGHAGGAALAASDSMDARVCTDPLVAEAVWFIASHAREHLQVEDVVQHMNVPRSTLIRWFDQALGRSVASEISRHRVAEVKRMLMQTRLSITKISEICGFSCCAQLSRFFCREVGVPPSVWRKQNRVSKGGRGTVGPSHGG